DLGKWLRATQLRRKALCRLEWRRAGFPGITQGKQHHPRLHIAREAPDQSNLRRLLGGGNEVEYVGRNLFAVIQAEQPDRAKARKDSERKAGEAFLSTRLHEWH